jgi:hypothetical protein
METNAEALPIPGPRVASWGTIEAGFSPVKSREYPTPVSPVARGETAVSLEPGGRPVEEVTASPP